MTLISIVTLKKYLCFFFFVALTIHRNCCIRILSYFICLYHNFRDVKFAGPRKEGWITSYSEVCVHMCCCCCCCQVTPPFSLSSPRLLCLFPFSMFSSSSLPSSLFSFLPSSLLSSLLSSPLLSPLSVIYLLSFCFFVPLQLPIVLDGEIFLEALKTEEDTHNLQLLLWEISVYISENINIDVCDS